MYDANDNLPSNLSSKDNTVAIRVTKDPMLCDLISMLGCPLVSTSANKQGISTPRHFSEIDVDVIKQVDYVFKSGRKYKEKNPPSMLIKFNEEGELIFLRK